MNNACRIFLALNAILNGKSMLLAFDNSVELASQALNMTVDKVAKLDESLNALNSATWAELSDPVTATLVNFFRNDEYAFIAPRDIAPIGIKAIAAFESQGNLDVNSRRQLLTQVIRYTDVAPTASDIRIADGVIYIPENMSYDTLIDRIVKAYLIVTKAPSDKSSPLMKNRWNLTVSTYKKISPTMFNNICKGILTYGVPAVVYRDTLLMIPDYMVVYKNAGVIAELSPTAPNVLNVLLPIVGTDTAKVVPINLSTVAALVGDNVRGMANLQYDPTYANSSTQGLVVPGD